MSGAFTIEGVPNGRYVVLAAFENDRLVRDPDQSIGGTAIQRISVAGAAVDVPGFKITGALAVVGPGQSEPEVVSPDVTFEWEDDSSEDGYEVTVLDTFGNEVWKNADVPRVTGSPSVTLAYAGPALEPGYYQFRAVSWRDAKGKRTYISASSPASVSSRKPSIASRAATRIIASPPQARRSPSGVFHSMSQSRL